MSGTVRSVPMFWPGGYHLRVFPSPETGLLRQVYPRLGPADSNLVQVNRRTNWRPAATERFSFLVDRVLYSARQLHFFQEYLDSLPSGPFEIALVELHKAVHGIEAPRINTSMALFALEGFDTTINQPRIIGRLNLVRDFVVDCESVSRDNKHRRA